MNEFITAIHAIHFIGTLALFGEFVFLIYVARPLFRETLDPLWNERCKLHRQLLQVSSWSLVAIFASGLLWLMMETVLMSGLAPKQAITREILAKVLNDTLFGLVWKVRFGLAVVLVALLAVARERTDDRALQVLGSTGVLLAGALLAMLAWAGHAAGERGVDHAVHLLADAVHLLAAGAWFGALISLVLLLARAVRIPSPETLWFAAHHAARRFSTLGIVSMTLLVMGGIVNYWYTVGSIGALAMTHYGRLLFLKLILFGAVLELAAFNRLRLTPQLLVASDAMRGLPHPPALSQLCRNAIIEVALGVAILSVVGVLGVTIPASHMRHLHHMHH
jgi:copper resistance protein D